MQNITNLICLKSNISYIVFDENFSILDFSDHLENLVDESEHLMFGADIRDIMWELVGMEERMHELYENSTYELHFPMILKGNEYYDLDIELFEDSVDKYFIAYLSKKTRESLSYANTIKEMNKKTLIYESEHKQSKEEHYQLINKRVLNFNVDMDGRITLVNDAFLHFFVLGRDEILGEHFSLFFKARDLSMEDKTSMIFNALNMNSEMVAFHANIIPIQKDGVINENIIVCQDITYLREIEKELEFASEHDSLTGLCNQFILFKRVDELIKKCDKSGDSFMFYFIDVDNFKAINDNYGHHAGDMLLKHIAEILSDFVRKDDLVARVGGDKFVLLFDMTFTKESKKIMKKRIEDLAQKSSLVYTQDDIIDFSFNIGVVSYPKDADNAADLLKKADKAMYKTKKK